MLEKSECMEEYKQIQNLLSPLKLDNMRKEKMEKALGQIDQLTSVSPLLEANKRANILDPILPPTITNAASQLHSSNVFSTYTPRGGKQLDNVGINSTVAATNEHLHGNTTLTNYLRALPNQKIRLEEMITLNVLKSSSGCVRKVLHAPSLQVFAVKEVPIWNREIR